jgi:polyribonucleotide nucleotidyltransferase
VGERQVRILDRNFTLEWGKIAPQANGAVLVRENETVVLVAVVAEREPRGGTDFFPLTVEYRERFSAVGRFPGGYRKREAAASTQEILNSRLIDRSIRPLFPDGFRCETQVLATVLAAGPDGDPAILAILGASAALHLSDIPWDGPVAAIRVGRSPDGGLVVNPTAAERAGSSLDLVASLTSSGLVMLEARAGELPEEEVLAAIDLSATRLGPLLDAMEGMRAEGRPKRSFQPPVEDPALREAVEREAAESITRAASTSEKQARGDLLRDVGASTVAALAARFEGREAEIVEAVHALTSRTFRSAILDGGRRADGRSSTDIRPIHSDVGLLPRVHGSSLFTRGETQALVVCTLGTGRDEQEVEGLGGIERETFQLYYRFPSYSVGEVRPLRAPGRREIGHGNLARRALEPVLPSRDVFPYTIKIESEITSSNGSSSMASVCGGCLALMDAGVPIRRPVAGIAMGLIRDGERLAILSDILGDEDHLGDMDFKVAGTETGVTAVQLDNKLGSLPIALLTTAMGQAREGRIRILREMARAIARPRPHLSPHAPRVAMVKIGTHRIRDLIGAGGRVIQAVQADTGSKIDVADDGTVRIYTADAASLDQTLRRVRDLTGEPEVGKFYRGVVTGVKEFGAFVRLFEGIEGLVHVTELAEGDVRDITRAVSPGDEMVVKVLGVDGQGKIKLSRRQALNVPSGEIANA